MHSQALLGAAVTNNALWCDAVCRSHGHPGVFSARSWINADHGLDLYPNAITLCPDVAAAEIAPVRDLSRRYAVKDSFALLDLVLDGFTLLFEAQWIARTPAPAGPGQPGLCWGTVTDAGELGRWEAAWPRARLWLGRSFGQNC